MCASGVQLVVHLIDITPQDRRQVGIDNGGVAARNDLHQGAGLIGCRDLGEAHVAGDGGDAALMFGIAIAVHEYDGAAPDAVIISALQTFTSLVFIELDQHLAPRPDALVDLKGLFVEHFWELDMAVEKPGPILVTDAEHVGETTRGNEEGPFTLALQQRVGSHCGAHLDGFDPARRNRRINAQIQQLADALNGRVLVAFRVIGQ